MDYSQFLASRTSAMDPSAIRELFKVLGTPGMLSLAGGAPAPECLPFDSLKHRHEEVLEKYGNSLLQYGITEGFLPLREQLAAHLGKRGISVAPQSVFISTGAQTAIDAIGKITIDKGDTIALESPTFLASIKTFKAYEPNCVGIPMDEEGVIPDALEKILKDQQPKFVYLIPNFQNPSGRTLTLERRNAVVALAKQYQTLIIEDDPYYELRYSGEQLPTLYSMLPEQVVYIGSMSKIFAPGMRVGYFVGPEPLTSLMTSSRQAVDVHTNTYAQALAATYLSSGDFERALPTMQEIYKRRRDTLLSALDEHFPESCTWSKPDGGMFVWFEGPDTLEVKKWYLSAIEQKVAFVPGAPFFIEPKNGAHCARFNFTNVNDDNIKVAVERLGALLKDLL